MYKITIFFYKKIENNLHLMSENTDGDSIIIFMIVNINKNIIEAITIFLVAILTILKKNIFRVFILLIVNLIEISNRLIDRWSDK